MIIKSKNKNGFTLVELIIAITLFATIAFFSIGSLLSIFDAHRKAQSSKTVMDNFNMSVENMVRNIRFGSNYFCGISTDNTEPIEKNDCPGGGESISVTFEGERIIYKKEGTSIQKSIDEGKSYTSITSSDTKIQNLKFYVFNTTSGDDNQPYVIIVISGYSGGKSSSQTDFSIQTIASQRKLDY